jgi:hypothetical protein
MNIETNIESGWTEQDRPTEYQSLNAAKETEHALADAKSSGVKYQNPVTLEGEPLAPCFMADTAGNFMFAASSVVTIFGEPGSRKSFLLQTAIANHHGIMVQLETSPQGMKRRLIQMAYPESATSRYVFPESKAEILDCVREWVELEHPTIIGFDSFGPLMAFWSGDTNQDKDVQKIFNEVLHPLRNAGHCVVFLDHTPKNNKNVGFAIGSQNKKAQVDLALRIDVEGSSKLHVIYVTKDRENIYGDRGLDYSGVYGFLELSEFPNPLRANINVDGLEDITANYKDMVSVKTVDRKTLTLSALKEFSPTGKESLFKAVGGNRKAFDKILIQLADEGSISVDGTGGVDKQGSRVKVLVSLLQDLPFAEAS